MSLSIALRRSIPPLCRSAWPSVVHRLADSLPAYVQGPLSQRDRSLIDTLRAGALAAEPAWLDELQAMEELDAKAELEALYGHPAGFAQLLADSLASGDFE